MLTFGKRAECIRNKCYLERGWAQHRHLAVMVIAWETSDNWGTPYEVQRGNREVR